MTVAKENKEGVEYPDLHTLNTFFGGVNRDDLKEIHWCVSLIQSQIHYPGERTARFSFLESKNG